jgi:hypothetical protein
MRNGRLTEAGHPRQFRLINAADGKLETNHVGPQMEARPKACRLYGNGHASGLPGYHPECKYEYADKA